MGITAFQNNAVAAELGVLGKVVTVLDAAVGIGSQKVFFINFCIIRGVDMDRVLSSCIGRNILKLVARLTMPELTEHLLLRLIDRSVSDAECFCVTEGAVITDVGVDAAKAEECLPLV